MCTHASKYASLTVHLWHIMISYTHLPYYLAYFLPHYRMPCEFQSECLPECQHHFSSLKKKFRLIFTKISSMIIFRRFLLSLFYRRFFTVAFLLSLAFIAYFLPLAFSTQQKKPMHLHPQAHGSHSFPIPIFDVSVPISLHHLLHHFCLKLHHFPINYDTLAFLPKSRKPLKTLHSSAFSEVLKEASINSINSCL